MQQHIGKYVINLNNEKFKEMLKCKEKKIKESLGYKNQKSIPKYDRSNLKYNSEHSESSVNDSNFD